jgi:microcystin degradation protein MlrC
LITGNDVQVCSSAKTHSFETRKIHQLLEILLPGRKVCPHRTSRDAMEAQRRMAWAAEHCAEFF